MLKQHLFIITIILLFAGYSIHEYSDTRADENSIAEMTARADKSHLDISSEKSYDESDVSDKVHYPNLAKATDEDMVRVAQEFLSLAYSRHRESARSDDPEDDPDLIADYGYITDSNYLTLLSWEAMHGSPDWKVELEMNEKTGIISVLTKCTSERELFLDLYRNFPESFKATGIPSFVDVSLAPDPNKEIQYGFIIDSPEEIKHKGIVEEINKSNEWFGGVPSPKKKFRFVELENNETFYKEYYIWDFIENWDVLCKILSEHRKIKLEISKSIGITIDKKPFRQRGKLIIDYQFVQKMERLRKNRKTSIEKSDALPFQTKFEFDDKNGEFAVYFFNRGKEDVLINLDELYGDFENRFTLKSKTIGDDFSPMDDTDGFNREKNESGKYRKVTLENGECVSRKIKIWDMSIWDELCRTIEDNRSKKYDIVYEIEMETNDKPIKDSLALEMDYRKITRLQKLREAIGNEK